MIQAPSTNAATNVTMLCTGQPTLYLHLQPRPLVVVVVVVVRKLVQVTNNRKPEMKSAFSGTLLSTNKSGRTKLSIIWYPQTISGNPKKAWKTLFPLWCYPTYIFEAHEICAKKAVEPRRSIANRGVSRLRIGL